MISRRLAKY